jgi:hypothetical protein
MPIYTLCSTNKDHYNEIIVSIPFYNSEKVVDLTVLSLCTLWNVELLNENDFMDLVVGIRFYHVNMSRMSKLDMDGLIEYLTYRMELAGVEGVKVEVNSTNRLEFKSSEKLEMVKMSYNLRMATGFYYLNDKNNMPIVGEKIGNEWIIGVEAVPFCSSTPILYLLSNTGGNCYRMNLDADGLQTGTISMIINNSFNSGLPAIHQQADITTRVYSSDLSFMRMVLCDCNLRPIKLFCPMFITLSISEVAEA